MRRKGNDWKRPVGRHPTVDKSGTVFLHRFVVLRFGRFGATKVKISPYPENEKLFHFIGETSPHTILSGNHTLSPGTQTYFLPLPDNYTGLIHTKSRQIQHKNRQIAVGTVRASAENRGSEAAPGSRTKPELRQNGIGRQSETPRPSQQPPVTTAARHNSRPTTASVTTAAVTTAARRLAPAGRLGIHTAKQKAGTIALQKRRVREPKARPAPRDTQKQGVHR